MPVASPWGPVPCRPPHHLPWRSARAAGGRRRSSGPSSRRSRTSIPRCGRPPCSTPAPARAAAAARAGVARARPGTWNRAAAAPLATCSATGRAGCQPASASVVRSTTASAPSARCSATTRTVPAGVPAAAQGFQRPGDHQEWVSRAALAHAQGEVVGHHGRIERQLLDQPGDGPAVHAGDHQAARRHRPPAPPFSGLWPGHLAPGPGSGSRRIAPPTAWRCGRPASASDR